MNWKPVYAILILFSTIVTWACGLLLEKQEGIKQRKIVLSISLIINFGILFVFKYFNFINETIFALLDYFQIRWEIPNLDVLLPVGISFYTFQAVGYTIDVYRRNIKAEKHFGIYALFVSFFPQLVAGPIERAKNLLPQFKEIKKFSFENFSSGFQKVIWGYFLKLVLADRLAIYVNAIFNNVEHHSGSSLSLASFLFAFQIYGDFAGYSLIAIGVAKIMGFNLMTNFNRPYFAESIGSFWKRWHISLSTWFKDYLYIPLGGNRKSPRRTYFNLFFTFLVSGVWHGANFTFIIWGALHGFFLIIEKFVGVGNSLTLKTFSLLKAIRIFFTFFLVTLSWVFFRANSLGDAFLILKKIFGGLGDPLFINYSVFFAASLSLTILLSREIIEEFFSEKLIQLKNNKPIRLITTAFLLSVIILFGVFNESQFIYFQF